MLIRLVAMSSEISQTLICNTCLTLLSYKSRADAETLNLISASSTSAKWGVGQGILDPADNSIRGRPSVRLEGKRAYTKGLFIADIAHMPGNACGMWPAFWTLGSGEWPLK
jgi:hypothetical protein